MKKQLLSGLLLFSVSMGVMAQKAQKPALTVKSLSEQGNAILITPGNATQLDLTGFLPLLKTELKLDATNDELRLVKEETDQLGFTHYRYQHYYKGLLVEGSEYIVHTKAGLVTLANGKTIQGLNLNTAASISESQGLNAAIRQLGNIDYRWKNKEAEQELKAHTGNAKASYLPKGKLVIAPYAGEGEIANNYRLCFKYTILGTALNEAWDVYVDAATGELVNRISLICSGNDVAGKVKTHYHGTRNVTCYQDSTTDSIPKVRYSMNQKRRHAPLRSQEIVVYDYKNNTKQAPVERNKLNVIYCDSTNFTSDPIAGEIYYGLQNTSDFFETNFQRHSIDNKGHKIIGLAHFNKKYGNANWSTVDTMMIYGDGDGVQLNPVVGIDITGHELTHGVTSFSAKLVYQAESGALNESFSDIMGAGVEFHALGDSAANWLIGEGVLIIAPGHLRSMSNPNNGYPEQPDTYKGKYWVPTTGTCSVINDQCGVHTNSGVLNFWFYLLCKGGSGTNDLNYNYSVNSIGMQKALQIAYRTLTVYLTSSSKYNDAATFTEQAAKDLYGNNAPEVAEVVKAWCAVGIGCGQVVCEYALATTTKTFTLSGGADAVSLTAPSTCTWTTTVSCTWVKIDAANLNGLGDKTIPYTVEPNPPGGAKRTCIITAGGKKYTITQNANPANTGINDPAAVQLSIYPNPTNGNTLITCAKPITELHVYDLQGREISVTKTTSSDGILLNLSGKEAGIYLLSCSIADKVYQQKLILSK